MSPKANPHKLLTSIIDWMHAHPVSVLAGMMLLTYLAFQFTANNLSINTDTAELIAPDAPFQQNRRKFETEFSQDMHTLLLVVESETPELTKLATKRLGRLLHTDTKNIDRVYIPNDSEFFQQNGLLYLESEDLQTIAGNLSEAQPFIGRISQEPNLTGFFSIFEDALTKVDKQQELPVDLPTLINKVALVLHRSINGHNALLSWQELIADKQLNSTLATKGFIVVLPKFDYSQIRPAEQAINSIHGFVHKIQDTNLPKVKVWVTGEVGLEDDELLGMSSGTFTASVFSVVLVCGILLLAYRSVWFTLATLLTLALGMVFCGAFAALSVKQLNLISVAFAVSNIGLGVEYAIHFCLRYRDNLAHHIERGRALYSTLLSTSPSLILCAGTTAIGLYAFIPTSYEGVSELGLLAGTSLFICLLITLTVLPALLKIIPASAPPELSGATSGKKPLLLRLSENMAQFTLHYAKPIVLVTAVLAVISIILIFKVETDFNPINLRDPHTESVIAFKELTKDKETTPMTLTILANDEAKAKALQQQLSKVATVDKTVSLFDFVPTDQDSKLAMIEDMALTLGTTQTFPELKPDPNPVPGIERLIRAIDSVLPSKTDPREIKALTGFKKELQDMLLEMATRLEPNRQLFIDKVQTALLGSLPHVMNDMYAGFKAREISIQDLPPDIKDRWLSKNGWYRIQIFPKKDLNNLTDLQEFITDVQAVAPETTDLPIMYWESMKEVIAAFQQAIVIALVTIAVLLYTIRRNLADTALVMTPLLLAGLLTMASTVLTGTPINFANIIALPLLLGLGVDNGIHMVEKLRHSLSENQNIYQSSTARAMFYGALTTASSFAGLAFSPHQGIASMGLIITIGIFWIMTCTFVVLPALSKVVLKSR